MKKGKKIKYMTKSLRTFFLYAFLVSSILIVAISIRAFQIYSKSLYDGGYLLIAVMQNKKLNSLIGFNTGTKKISILEVKTDALNANDYSEKLGVLPAAQIESEQQFNLDDPSSIFEQLIYRPYEARTELTIFDKFRLLTFSKSIEFRDIQRETITSLNSESTVDIMISELFSDSKLTSENKSIQILNSTEIPGLGHEYERVITNMGGNIVDVSTSRYKSKTSKILYQNDSSYTLKKLQKTLNFPLEKSSEKLIADIVIVIGDNYNNL